MSNFINAPNTSYNVGKKGHIQYNWSYDIDEKMTQFFFQLVRTKDYKLLEQHLNEILTTLKGKLNEYNKMTSFEVDEVVERLTIMYKLIGQTRDIIHGKGEQQLSFMQICVWYEHFPSLALNAFTYFVDLEDEHPYGSWKDIKYCCNFVKEKFQDDKHPIILHACLLMVAKLKEDWENFSSMNGGSKISNDNKPISLAAKWVPREPNYKKKKNVKFGWLFKRLAMNAFPHFLQYTSKDEPTWHKAVLKCKIHFKKRITIMNKFTDTIQIKQCNKQWQDINFNSVTTQTMRKQLSAFQNKTKNGQQKSELEDRKLCAVKFKNHIESAKSNPQSNHIHGRRCNVYELVKDAMQYPSYDSNTSTSIDTINLQWEDNRKNNMGLMHSPIVSLVDTSCSMECSEYIPLYNAIGLGIRTSELTHPAFRNKILTFDSTPKWVNMDDCETFWHKVHKIKKAACGTSANIYLAFKMILDACVQNNVPPSEVEGMILAIYSDMNINCNDTIYCPYNNQVLADEIDTMYALAGYRHPHLLFWNLRSTDGFPMVTTKKNITALSGYNATLLNIFCNKGLSGLKEFTSNKTLENILKNNRYDKMNQDIIMFVNN